MAGQDRELVQIEAQEDVNSVRDRLSFFRGRQVLLVWPEEGTALNRKLDLVLIQREAMRRAIRLALVTHDPAVIRYAQELNISTFETIGASERNRWKRGRSKVFTNRFHRPKEDPNPEDLMNVASRVRSGRLSLSNLQRLLLRLSAVLIFSATMCAVIIIILPSATIIVVPAAQWIEASEQIVVSLDSSITDIDVENATLPATILRLQVEETAVIPTTGAQNLGNVRAVGIVTFINNTSEDIPIPTGTNVSTSAGAPITFRTTEEAFVRAGDGEEVDVPIEAMTDSEGAVGNVPENMINTIIGPLEERVTVINRAATSGGFSRVESSVSISDHETLFALVQQQIYARAYSEMLAQTTDDQRVIWETLRIDEAAQRDDWTTFSAQPGEVIDTVSMTMRAIVEGVVVDTRLGEQIVFARMADQIPHGRMIRPDTIEYTQGDVIFVDGRILFTMSGIVQVVGQISEEQIRQNLAGRTRIDAMDYLVAQVDVPAGTPPEIILSMNWFDRLPFLPMRIKVIVHDPPLDPTNTP